MSKLTGWQLVVVIVAGLAAAVVLVRLGQEAGALITGALAILGAFGYTANAMSAAKADIAAVKQQTNGNTSELLAALREVAGHNKDLAGLLATMTPTQATEDLRLEDLRPVSPAR
jgi:apolipoprotein N-acyltransferase